MLRKNIRIKKIKKEIVNVNDDEETVNEKTTLEDDEHDDNIDLNGVD